jgi:predicted enzyme related to lactoylglutathione lyase
MTKFITARSVLAVRDLERSTRYYIDVLGFTEDPIQAAGWSFLSRDALHLMLGECADEVPAGDTGNHSWFIHVLVEDLDAYVAEIGARGAQVISAPADRSYGLRECVLGTPDGHRIVLGERIEERR